MNTAGGHVTSLPSCICAQRRGGVRGVSELLRLQEAGDGNRLLKELLSVLEQNQEVTV